MIRCSDLERLGNPEERFGDTTLATDQDLAAYLEVAVCGIEAENSLWNAAKMPDYRKTELLKIRLDFVAPTIIVKREDETELLGKMLSQFLFVLCMLFLIGRTSLRSILF